VASSSPAAPQGPDGTPSVLHRLASAPPFTRAESLVADFYEDGLPQVALANLRQVCEASGASTATVARFARKLGFADFRALSRALHREALADLDRPGERLARGASMPSAGQHMLDSRFDLALTQVEATCEQLSVPAFERVSMLLQEVERPLVLAAVASGRPLMTYFGTLLRYLRGQVTVLPGTDQWAHAVAGMTSRWVVLAAAFDRDPLPMLPIHALLRFARRRGATTVLITNRPDSPLLRDADHVLVVAAGGDAVFRTRAPLLVLFEALLDAVGSAEPQAVQRAGDIEELFDTLGGYLPRPQD